MRKGQMLVITAIIVVTVLILIKIEFGFFAPITERNEANIINMFGNIRNELIRAGEIMSSTRNYTDVYVFSDFLSSEEDLEIFYTISDFHDDTLNITVVNFLNDTIQNIQISQNLTDETKTITSLSKKASDWVNFTSSPGSEESIEVNIAYVKGSSYFNHSFITLVGPNNRYTNTFFDLTLKDGNSYLRDKFSTSGKLIK